jgi:hypothetical protein
VLDFEKSIKSKSTLVLLSETPSALPMKSAGFFTTTGDRNYV